METQTLTDGSGVPVLTQKSYPNVRLHIQGDKLFAMWDVYKPGILSKIDYTAYLVVEGDKFAERGYGQEITDSEAKPLMSLGTAFRPRVDSHIMNIVNNLLSTQDSLRNFAAWQIDFAHRQWSVSEDYPDESLVVRWIPIDTASSKLEYLTMQLGDRNRTIKDLDDIILELRKVAERERLTTENLKLELNTVEAQLQRIRRDSQKV